MKKIMFEHYGKAADVARLVDTAAPTIARANDVLISLIASPINPSDLLTAEGVYGVMPVPLPSGLGKEALGKVLAVGDAVKKITPGDVVYFSPIDFAWSEQFVIQERFLTKIAVNPAVDILQYSMAAANPMSAYIMLERYVDLKPGDWVIQNAANSSVGMNVITIAKERNIKTINLVRSETARERMLAAGVKNVIVSGNGFEKAVLDVTQGESIRLALDAIGGTATDSLANCLAPGGVVVNYGLLSGEPCVISPANLIFKSNSLRGFWLTEWFKPDSIAYAQSVMDKMIAKISSGELSMNIEKAYPLAEYKLALEHAYQPGRSGKIVLTGPSY